MVNIQFSNQENQANFVSQAPAQTQVNTADMPKTTKYKFVPVAVVLAFVFTGSIIAYRLQSQQKNKILGIQEETIVEEKILRETQVQPQDQVISNLVANSDTVKATPRPILNTEANEKKTPAPVATPRPKVVVNQAKTTPKPTTATKTTTTTTQPAIMTTYKVTEQETTSENNKPNTPTLESCGEYDGSTWQKARIRLPRLNNNNVYKVQIGKNYGQNDVYEHIYEQNDQVIFDFTLNNNQDYYVRFAVKGEISEFGPYSNTLKINCNRK